MIGCFPRPYPDELLYSVFARLRELLEFPSGKTFLVELFGTANVIAVVDLPGHLDALLDRLPRGHGYTAEQIIDELTLLPYYTPFLPPDRAVQLRGDMRDGQGSGIHMRSGIMASSVRKVEYLRLCPRCQEEDIAHWGEAYWHRSHQLPGVVVCPDHTTPLLQTSVRCSNGRTRYFYTAARTITGGRPLNLPAGQSRYEPLISTIAHESAWLLKYTARSFQPQQLRQGYRTLLRENGFLMATGRLRAAAFLTAFRAYYGDELLAWWGCALHTQQEPWLLRIVRDCDNAHHPLKHLLVLTFFRRVASDFFKSLEQKDLPEIVKDRSSVGFTTPNNTLPDILAARRVEWLELCAQYPDIGVKTLRQKAGGLYIKLYRQDRHWLQTHTPQRKSREHVQGRIDWASRDQELAQRVPQAAEIIRRAPGRPQQVTRTELGKRLGVVALLQQHLDKLPQTQSAIATLVETREDFAVRRIHWAIEQYYEERVTPKPWELIRRSGVSRLTHLPLVQKALDTAMSLCNRPTL